MSAPVRNLDSIDILKFVLSLFIVAIHTSQPGHLGVLGLCPWISPLLRLAVPLFFMVSAYFFFSKWGKLEAGQARRAHLKKFTKRSLLLYLFWFVVLLAPTVIRRGWLDMGLGEFIANFLRCLFLGSTFVASWYLMALLLGTLVVVFLSRYLKNSVLVVIGILVYVVCCADSNYFNLWIPIPLLGAGYELMSNTVGYPATNFCVALLWISMGKTLADAKLAGKAPVPTKVLWPLLILGLVLLLGECLLVNHFGWAATSDCFLMLPLPVWCIFQLVLRWKVRCRFAAFMRAFSTITYCLHGTLLLIMTVMAESVLHLHVSSSCMELYVVVVIICFIVTAIILRLEKVRHLGWLRVSH